MRVPITLNGAHRIGLCEKIDEVYWPGAMMLQHLGHQAVHDAILTAIERVLREGARLTPDMGGKATTKELGNAIATSI